MTCSGMSDRTHERQVFQVMSHFNGHVGARQEGRLTCFQNHETGLLEPDTGDRPVCPIGAGGARFNRKLSQPAATVNG